MRVIDDLKAHVVLENIAGRYTKLVRAGQHRLKGLCPLHTESNPSFFVFCDTQSWYCFGCHKGGDVLDLVQEMEGWDFSSTLHHLALITGFPMPEIDAQTKAVWQQRKQSTDILSAAIVYFERLMHKPKSAGIAYAKKRGWNGTQRRNVTKDAFRDTIRAARLGYYDGDKQALQLVLKKAGIDLSAPAAQALLRTPGPSLVYPFVEHGSVVYFTVRLIEPPPGKPKAWNPPSDMLGTKPLYFNACYSPNAESITIVEGQGDAVTLAQWGMAGIASVGTSYSQDLLSLARKHKNIFLGVEKNAAGVQHAYKLAEDLNPGVRLVHWPEDDANAWLQNGGTIQDFQRLLSESPTWLDVLVEQAVKNKPATDADLKRIFMTMNQLDNFQLIRKQEEIRRALHMDIKTFRALNRAAQNPASEIPTDEMKYVVASGRICRKITDSDGTTVLSPLCNFNAQIVRDIVSDDGCNQQRSFVITGELDDGSPLPDIKIPAESYARMDWVLEKWGIQPLIKVGYTVRDHLRYAIQEVSFDCESDLEYAHLGWREIDGQVCFLSSKGGVGNTHTNVNLPVALQTYNIPVTPNQSIQEAVHASLRFWDVGDLCATVPLWSMMYLAPLSSLIKPSFTLWIYGTTGTMKSTLTALAMCHYGQFSYDTPSTSWSSTAFALRRLSFLAKDVPLWIDDFTHQSSVGSWRNMQQLAEGLLREWGNRAMRSAGRKDGTLRAVNYPRGLVVSTGEELPTNVSIRARLVSVQMHPKMVVGGKDSKLTRAQKVDATLYPSAMSGYLLWLAKHWQDLELLLKEKLTEHLSRSRERLTYHQRTAMNTAMLCVGLELGLRFAQETGVLDHEGFEGMLSAGCDILYTIGDIQEQTIIREYDSVMMYFSALDNMLVQGSCHIRSRKHPEAESLVRPKLRTANSMLLGWYDDLNWYLLPQIAYQLVYQFYKASGVLFPDSDTGVRTKLRERGLIAVSNHNRNTYQLRIGDERKWVLAVPIGGTLTRMVDIEDKQQKNPAGE